MKKLVSKLMLACFLVAGVFVNAQNHDAVTDSISIDDQAPILYDEDAYEEEEESSNGVYYGIAIAVAVLGGGIVAFKKKKK